MSEAPTFSEWKARYGKWELPFWSKVRYSNSVWHLGFVFRIRHPDRFGRFDKGHGGWCWPWNWYANYYAALFPQTQEDA
jgi:hypothetical protein